MAWYNNFVISIRNNPATTVFFAGVLACIGTYYIGKWEQRREPTVKAVILAGRDINDDGFAPDGAIEFLNGTRKAIFMQPDGRTLLTYEGLSQQYEKHDESVNLKRRSNGEMPQKNPLDEPFNYRFAPATSHSSNLPPTYSPPASPQSYETIPGMPSPSGHTLQNNYSPQSKNNLRPYPVARSSLETMAAMEITSDRKVVPIQQLPEAK